MHSVIVCSSAWPELVLSALSTTHPDAGRPDHPDRGWSLALPHEVHNLSTQV